jgi:hypothetical protein
MIYEFQANDGEIIEEHFSMAEVPSVGETIEREGKEYTRIFSSEQKVHDYKWFAYESRALPKRLPGFKHSKNGNTIIESRKQEREVMSKYGYERD